VADVIVVGGGIIGLTAAVRLGAAGADVQVWSPVDPLDTVSAVAAAVWYPAHTDYDPRVLRWARDSYDEFLRQAAAGVPGVLLRPTRNLGAATEMPWWAPAGASLVDGEVRFAAPLAEMADYLPWLAAQVRLVRRRVDRLDEAFAQAPVVVNATGLAARELAGDPAVHPARGQIVLVANPGLQTSVRTEGTYVHPRRRDVVLGGTYQEDDWNITVDPATREAILLGCRALVPALAGVPVVGERVGLRPARRGGPRVEAVPAAGGTIVHAYGHGGAGMTLSWGCADEIVRLCQRDGRKTARECRTPGGQWQG
jgi:D-amino-acid oxidase